MASLIPDKEHIRHCMLYEFHKGSNATLAAQNICEVYPRALDVRKCQRWFCRFKNGNFDLSDSYRSGRRKTFDIDALKAEVEANPWQTIGQLSNTLNQPKSTVQEHLHKIGKVNRAGVWVPHYLSEENKASLSKTYKLLHKRLKSSNFDLSNSFSSGRQTTIDNDVLRAEVESNPCQTIGELSKKLNQPSSTVQKHLRQIGKVNKAGVWVPKYLSEGNKANLSKTCKLLHQQDNTQVLIEHLVSEDEK